MLAVWTGPMVVEDLSKLIPLVDMFPHLVSCSWHPMSLGPRSLPLRFAFLRWPHETILALPGPNSTTVLGPGKRACKIASRSLWPGFASANQLSVWNASPQWGPPSESDFRRLYPANAKTGQRAMPKRPCWSSPEFVTNSGDDQQRSLGAARWPVLALARGSERRKSALTAGPITYSWSSSFLQFCYFERSRAKLAFMTFMTFAS